MSLKPIVFSDGSYFYKGLEEKYIKHHRGFFILAPSGAGKTHFCKSQSEPHWIDGDDLWIDAGAQPPPSTKWWTMGEAVINHVDQRSDVVTMEARMQGFWIVGASSFWFRPDAIVIPDWELHMSYIKHRQENNYDGGATLDALEQVKSHIEFIRKWHEKHAVPLFTSVNEAVTNLTAE